MAQGLEGNLNGYSAQEMASIYSGEIPENVYFDEGFASFLENTSFTTQENGRKQEIAPKDSGGPLKKKQRT